MRKMQEMEPQFHRLPLRPEGEEVEEGFIGRIGRVFGLDGGGSSNASREAHNNAHDREDAEVQAYDHEVQRMAHLGLDGAMGIIVHKRIATAAKALHHAHEDVLRTNDALGAEGESHPDPTIVKVEAL